MRQLIVSVILFSLVLSACASKKPVVVPEQPEACPLDSPADLKFFPQNLQVYADQAGKDKRLLSKERQDEFNAAFNRIYFGPWHMRATSIKRGEVSGVLRKARGYKNGSRVWTQQEWDDMRRNANLADFPSMAARAITLRNTDLREVPTHEPRFSKPTPNVRDNPFDYFQYSLLPVGTPLLVAHATQDGRWYYVECPIAGGWVDAADVGMVDDNFQNIWTDGEFVALVRDNVNLPGIGGGGGDGKSGIGATLPLKSRRAGGFGVLVPVKGPGGRADTAEITLSASDAALRPMPLTPGNVAKVGNVMMGQPYGWGGMLGERDCSALVRDLFTPFGLWLPRNSQAQARRGGVISLQGKTATDKARLIMREAVPFLSLLGMRGHICLYIGTWKEQPAIFHNVWGLRIHKDGNDNERLVIGRAVVTSITPGMELENLYRPVTFVDRLRTITNIGEH